MRFKIENALSVVRQVTNDLSNVIAAQNPNFNKTELRAGLLKLVTDIAENKVTASEVTPVKYNMAAGLISTAHKLFKNGQANEALHLLVVAMSDAEDMDELVDGLDEMNEDASLDPVEEESELMNPDSENFSTIEAAIHNITANLKGSDIEIEAEDEYSDDSMESEESDESEESEPEEDAGNEESDYSVESSAGISSKKEKAKFSRLALNNLASLK